MFRELLSSIEGKVCNAPLPTIETQKDDRYTHRLLQEADEALESPVPALPLSLYRRFSETGNRVDYETPYFARRKDLAALVLGYAVGHEMKYLLKAEILIKAILDEKAWQLPAHNSYIRDAETLPEPDTKRPIIDLFSADTAADLAMAAHILTPDLSASLKEQICDAILIRIKTPYLESHFWWMGSPDDESKTCNWSPWCTENVLIALSILPLDQTELKKVIDLAATSLDFFLKDYGEDGFCTEGPAYFSHATLPLLHALSCLSSMSEGAFDVLWKNPKLYAMASFLPEMHVGGKWYINYADSSPRLEDPDIRAYLYGKALDCLPLASLANIDRSLKDEISLSIRTLALIHHNDARLEREEKPIKDSYYPSAHMAIFRSPSYTLAMKAGDNDDAHNHNDTGSIILYEKDQPLFIDVGVGVYTKTTFSEDRYTIWTMQSKYHNLTVFPGQDQVAGAAYRAEDVRYDRQMRTLSADLTHAYPPINGLGRYLRSVSLSTDGNSFTITDTLKGDCEGIFTLMSSLPPEQKGGCLWYSQSKLTLEGDEKISIEPIAITDERLRASWPETLYITRITYHHTLSVKGTYHGKEN